MKNSIQNNRYIQLFILIILGVIGNIFHYTLFLDIDFIFGSIFSLLIVRFFGFKWGLLSTIIISSYTIILWDNYLSVFILLIEILFVAYFFQYANKKNIIMVDIFYWFLVGIPLVYIFYYFFLDFSFRDITIYALKNAINGILNSILSAVLYLFFRKFFNTDNRKKLYFQEVIFIFFSTIFIIITSFSFIYEGKKEFQATNKELIEQMEARSLDVTDNLQNWYNYQTMALYLISNRISDLVDIHDIQGELKELYDYSIFKSIHVVNQNNELLTTYPNNELFNPAAVNSNNLQTINVSNTFIDPKDGSRLISITVPIINNNQYNGYISGYFESTSIIRMLQTISNFNMMQINFIDDRNLSFQTDLSPSEQDCLAYIIQNKKELLRHKKPILMHPLDEEQISITNWDRSSYLMVTNIDQLPWSIYLEAPLIHLQDHLFKKYIIIFLFMLGITLLIVSISHVLSRIMISPLLKLTDLTRNMPTTITRNTNLIWPKTSIFEILSLINHFKNMESELRRLFDRINEKKKQLSFYAHFDPLTKLHNRISFSRKFTEELVQAKNREKSLSIMFIDLDRFKVINDTLGHEAGDQLLIEASKILMDVCGENATICRQGGDEFIVLLTNLTDIKSATICMAENLLNEFSKPIMIDNNEVQITASIGISLFPTNGKEIDELIRNADIAMYKAKENGKNTFAFFDEELFRQFQIKTMMEKELSKALNHQELSLYYQPIIDLKSDQIIGLEALLRWNNPSLKSVPPSQFIPLAEETGLIIPIGNWVIEQACKDLVKLKANGFEHIKVGINVSIIQFLKEGFTNFLMDCIKQYQINPQLLNIEITESVIIKDIDLAVNRILELRGMGINVSLDDFGTGYSSLNYLKLLPIHSVKIDRSFITNISTDQQAHEIIRSILNITNTLQLKTVAEGVETENELLALKSMNCDQAQGYLFSKPLPLEDIILLLSKYIFK